MLDPAKSMHVCLEPREFRATTMEDIQYSRDDKRRGGGPRVGPFQETIPGKSWSALPKYDFTSRKRSSCFNERMHVEWENHADHILSNGGKLPTASVVAKAGFRSCAPCCRDMLALARPTGKTFIMVDLAEDDARGTFHFAVGDKYLPVPKEDCTSAEVQSLKQLVSKAQEGGFTSSREICFAVLDLAVPIDEAAQGFYLNDPALLPSGCAESLCGEALLKVLHAEHFARLPAEYGASVLRDAARSKEEKTAVQQCRLLAKQMLIEAWSPHLDSVPVDLKAYAEAAVTPLLPEDPNGYTKARHAALRGDRRPTASLMTRLQSIDESSPKLVGKPGRWVKKSMREDDGASVTTAAPDDAASRLSEFDDVSEL